MLKGFALWKKMYALLTIITNILFYTTNKQLFLW